MDIISVLVTRIALKGEDVYVQLSKIFIKVTIFLHKALFVSSSHSLKVLQISQIANYVSSSVEW